MNIFKYIESFFDIFYHSKDTEDSYVLQGKLEHQTLIDSKNWEGDAPTSYPGQSLIVSFSPHLRRLPWHRVFVKTRE